MTSDAIACPICVCAHVCHNGVATSNKRARRAKTLIVTKSCSQRKKSYTASCIAERGTKQTQECAKAKKVESYEYKSLIYADHVAFSRC